MIPGFDCLALASPAGTSLPGWGEVLLATASTGVVGMGLSDVASGLGERLSGGDGDDEGSTPDDDLPGGDGDDALGEIDDWDDEDGDLDGLGDDDELGGLGGDSGGQPDLEPRLEELENEVETISSTMGTVRSENEAISETVEDIEDNIRKLLDIYEMVTRGVNPFVDEGGGGGGGGVSGSFGLFEDTEEDEGPDDIDPDVADADPESFFDDDFEEGEIDDDEFDDDEFDDEGFATDTGPNDAADVQGDTVSSAPSRSESSDGSEGKTFEDLKSEYESGSTDWNEDAGPDDDERPADRTDDGGSIAEAADEGPATEANPEAPPEAGEPAPSASDRTETDPGTAEESGRSGDGEHARETGAGDEPPDTSKSTDPDIDNGRGGGDSAEASEETDDRHEVSDGSRSTRAASDGKPYLESLPAGYGAELLVVEWLTYLRGRSSTAEALRAIRYYQTIGWIGDAAADSLQRYLTGLTDGETPPTSTGGTQLTIDHHTNSLHYIGELGGKHVDVERLEWTRAGSDGGNDEGREQRGIQR